MVLCVHDQHGCTVVACCGSGSPAATRGGGPGGRHEACPGGPDLRSLAPIGPCLVERLSRSRTACLEGPQAWPTRPAVSAPPSGESGGPTDSRPLPRPTQAVLCPLDAAGGLPSLESA